MEKTIKLGKTSVKLSNSVEWLLIYREQFGKDILQTLVPIGNTLVELVVSFAKVTGGNKVAVAALLKALDVSEIQSALYSLVGLEFADIINIVWAMAKAADDEIDEPRTWVKGLEAFPVDAILPTVFDMNAKMLLTTKNYSRLQSAVEALKPTIPSTSTES